jgi:hypothetical protein
MEQIDPHFFISLRFQVFDEDKLKQDKRLGIAKLPLSDLAIETAQEVNLQLLSSLDTVKVKDKKDRGVLTIKARPNRSPRRLLPRSC